MSFFELHYVRLIAYFCVRTYVRAFVALIFGDGYCLASVFHFFCGFVYCYVRECVRECVSACVCECVCECMRECVRECFGLCIYCIGIWLVHCLACVLPYFACMTVCLVVRLFGCLVVWLFVWCHVVAFVALLFGLCIV